MIGATAPEEAGHVQTPAILALRSFPMHFNGSDMSPLIIMSLLVPSDVTSSSRKDLEGTNVY